MDQSLYEEILNELEEIQVEFMDEEELMSEYCDDHAIEEITLELNNKYGIKINLDWLKIYYMKVDEFIKHVITLIESK
ncbi:hypothetical protein ACFVQB_14345 [Paenibacillus sp. NPDC057886]|uniref:hypothetical protein n=1 Tax=Paenibacillus sp. NPDC057886 TaxID=3346270 RepID=UPI00368200E4